MSADAYVAASLIYGPYGSTAAPVFECDFGKVGCGTLLQNRLRR